MKPLAAVIAGAVLFLLGLALRKPCPSEPVIDPLLLSQAMYARLPYSNWTRYRDDIDRVAEEYDRLASRPVTTSAWRDLERVDSV